MERLELQTRRILQHPTVLFQQIRPHGKMLRPLKHPKSPVGPIIHPSARQHQAEEQTVHLERQHPERSSENCTLQFARADQKGKEKLQAMGQSDQNQIQRDHCEERLDFVEKYQQELPGEYRSGQGEDQRFGDQRRLEDAESDGLEDELEETGV